MANNSEEKKDPIKQGALQALKKTDTPRIVQSGEGSHVVVQHVHSGDGVINTPSNDRLKKQITRLKYELKCANEKIEIYLDEIAALKDEIEVLKDK